MRAVVQRVSSASVRVAGDTTGAIDAGLLVYLGVAREDDAADADWLASKIAGLRIFTDGEGKLNLSVTDVAGGVLVVSAFSTQADARKGRRPSFENAASPERANELYEHFCEELVTLGIGVQRGVFRAMMEVESVNDGPICILLDSKRMF